MFGVYHLYELGILVVCIKYCCVKLGCCSLWLCLCGIFVSRVLIGVGDAVCLGVVLFMVLFATCMSRFYFGLLWV